MLNQTSGRKETGLVKSGFRISVSKARKACILRKDLASPAFLVTFLPISRK